MRTSLVAFLALLAFSSCVSSPGPNGEAVDNASGSVENTSESVKTGGDADASVSASSSDAQPEASDAVTPAPASGERETLEKMRSLEESAREAFDLNHPIQGLKELVGILALDEQSAQGKDSAIQAEREALISRTRAEIAAYGTKLRFEYVDEWLLDGTPRIADARPAARGQGPMPSLRLVANYEYGKSVVRDAPVRFTFVEGLGDLDTQVLTDSYGVAATPLRGLSRADVPAVIRASLVISNRGKSIYFKDVFLDFSYAPLPRVARVFAFERAPGTSVAGVPDRGILDSLVRVLDPLDMDLIPGAGQFAAEDVSRIFAGDATVLPQGGGEDNSAFYILAFTEYEEPQQMVYNGKAFNIFTVKGRTQLRILRADGSVAMSLHPIGHRAQAANGDAAVAAFYDVARSDVVSSLEGQLDAIGEALAE